MSCEIIAEMASCHNGNIDLALAMVQAAKDAGIDTVKFQSWQARKVKDSDPDKIRYSSIELTDEMHRILIRYCREIGIKFLTSIFDLQRIPFLKSLELDEIKISSTDSVDTEFVREVAKNFKRVYVSTGMSSASETQQLIALLQNVEHRVMHCVSIYPTPPEKANLQRINWLKNLSPQVGYSDHVFGMDACKMAINMGAVCIEKHFTLSRYLPQAAHKTSAQSKSITIHEVACEPNEFKDLCAWRDLTQVMTNSNGSSSDADPEALAVRQRYTQRFRG